MLPRNPEWYVALLGMIKLGVLPMPATTMCTPKDIEYRINASDAAIVITDVENASKVDQVAGQCPSLKCLMTTRGSRTGLALLRRRDGSGLALSQMTSSPPAVTTPSWSISPPAPWATPRWCSTPRLPTALPMSSLPSSGTTSAPPICSGPSQTPVGPRQPTASSSASGPRALRSSSTTPRAASTPR